MKNLNEIISSSNTPVEFSLFDGSMTVSANRHIYTDVRNKYAEIADNALDQYLEEENTFQSLEDIVDNAKRAFKKVLNQAIQEVVNDAISVGIMTLDANTVYDEYCKAGYDDSFNEAYDAYANTYNEAKGEVALAKSRSVDASDVLLAAAMKSDMKTMFKNMFKDERMRTNLHDGVWNSVNSLRCYVIDYFPKKGNVRFSDNITNDSSNKASAALNNMQNNQLSDGQKKEFTKLILENNPFLDSAYVTFADIFPQYTKQFVIIGDFFRIKSIIRKANDQLIAFVNENMGSTEADLDYCKSLLEQKMSEIGLSMINAGPTYAVIQERAAQLDLEYRTVEGVILNSREEADATREAFSANAGILKKDCSELITRADYVEHINTIRALPIPQAITMLYAMQYEQKLNEFDKKCRLALLFEEANSGEKRSFKNRISSMASSSDAQKAAWDEVTHNGQYNLSDIMAGIPGEKGIAGAIDGIGKAAGKLKGLFGKK